MIELRKHVERIVRPIRASNLRKDRVREELLAHLTTIYDEELARRPDDAASALVAAFERFGDPAVLRGELQASVSWFEQLMCTPWEPAKSLLGRRPGERIGEYVRRSCLRSMVVNAVFWALLLLFLYTTHGRRPERAQEASLGWFTIFATTYVFFLVPAAIVGQILLGERLWRAWRMASDGEAANRRRMIQHVLGWLAASMALYVVIADTALVLIMRAVAIPLVSGFCFWAIILMSAVLGPSALILQIPDLKRWDAWEGLVLDERATPSS